LQSLALIGGSGFISKSIIEYIDRKQGSNLKIKKIYLYQRRKFFFKTKNIKLKFVNKDFLNVNNFYEIDYVIFGIKCGSIKRAESIYKHFEKKILSLKKKPKVIYISSGAVYGPISKNIQTPETKIIKINLINKFKNYKKNYAKEKIFLENKFLNLRAKKIKISIIRGFTFVGKYSPLNSIYLIGNFIKNIIQTKKLVLNSNIRTIRSYMYTDDLVRCIIKIFRSKYSDGEIYNVGSDNKIDINYLGIKLSKKFELKLEKKQINLNKTDYYVPVIKKIREKLKFKLEKNSYEAVIKTIKILKNQPR
tara:strand:+ start:2224 stop:3141 length:918 start_codon:yes stop_codon:yes gene_type:complete